jgi:predicted cupin superfamily sugar epimerase
LLFLGETTSHSTRLQTTAAKSLVIPRAGESWIGGNGRDKFHHRRWHTCSARSDEIWGHLEGDALELLCFDATNSQASTVALGRFTASGAAPIHVVPAGVWQAARPLGEYALLGCYVGPGFDFSDFRMAKDDAEMRRVIAQQGEGFAACL